ncbi:MULTISPECIES: hypothetical protein [unclassified Mesorhizobium]|uniref:hypothetical protein n=1 Tax=unclassified Mesorhizobium TaxID=325217 RepID=UPI000FDA0565|nr:MULTISPECIES: hypothetical protein [unclassified Mesorhizobium]TGQ07508.1 hypothetical protein EN862_023110 [Mesorhizobium sp. M2E.F.Ca.ET.219.01.1.1]TGT74179.1 hypothetical protein EN809_015375 [Mesorhizobium sp. M2E.F.Ca.ET.166.01.1.1]TGW00693.1 hypothetical protein EN797_021555 [Mesorhizobium sp. M2E.F.Ca.ET.154.01.1.1]
MAAGWRGNLFPVRLKLGKNKDLAGYSKRKARAVKRGLVAWALVAPPRYSKHRRRSATVPPQGEDWLNEEDWNFAGISAKETADRR